MNTPNKIVQVSTRTLNGEGKPELPQYNGKTCYASDLPLEHSIQEQVTADKEHALEIATLLSVIDAKEGKIQRLQLELKAERALREERNIINERLFVPHETE